MGARWWLGGQGRAAAATWLDVSCVLRAGTIQPAQVTISRIVIADSDNATREILTAFCGDAGYEVLPARTGPEAMDLVDEGTVDAIITRFYMPGPDGFDLVLQVLSRNPRPAIIALSEGDRFVSGKSLAMADRLGVDRVLSKPYTAASVAELLEEVLP